MALGNMPGMSVTPPEPNRRRYGLFDAAAGPLDLPSHGQGGGIRYVPETCGEAYVLGVNCYEPGEAPVKPIDGDLDEVESGVFVVMASLNCGAVGQRDGTLERKVLRRLEGTEQAAVERALWSGIDFEGNTLGIRSLDGTAVDIGGNYDPGVITDVVGALERYAYFTQQYGYGAVIHAPVEVAAEAASAGLILADGNRKVTPLGSVWAFGAYPAGEIIITGQTTVWRGASVDLAQGFDRTTNEMLLLAERAYAVSFDCFAGRAEYDPLEVTSP